MPAIQSWTKTTKTTPSPLQSFIHVSTAYANCNIADIEEVYYEMGEEYSPLKLLELCE